VSALLDREGREREAKPEKQQQQCKQRHPRGEERERETFPVLRVSGPVGLELVHGERPLRVVLGLICRHPPGLDGAKSFYLVACILLVKLHRAIDWLHELMFRLR